MEPSRKFIEQTQEFWSRRTGEPISRGDAEEAITNAVAFGELLARWERNAKKSADEEEESEARGNGPTPARREGRDQP